MSGDDVPPAGEGVELPGFQPRRISRAIFESVRADAFSPLVVDAIVEETIEAIREFLTTNPAFPPAANITASALRDYVLTKCGIFGADISLEDRLAFEITREIVEHYRGREDVVSRRAARRDQEQEQPPLDVIEDLRTQLGLEALAYLATFGGGLSGSTVLKVYMRVDETNEAVGVMKLTEAEEDHERELKGHEAAANSWLARWVVPPPTACHISAAGHDRRRFALLFRLAFPPSASGDDSDSLHTTICRGERVRAGGVVAELGRAYAEHLLSADREAIPVQQFVMALLAHWPRPSAGEIWTDAAFWNLTGLPSPNAPGFIDDGVVTWNPLWLLNHDLKEARENRVFFSSFQHGDLNARNILVQRHSEGAPAANTTLQLIDFEKAGIASSLLDLCWLSFSVLMAAASRIPRPSREQWWALPASFIEGVLLRHRRDEDLGALQLGVDLACGLLDPVCELASRFEERQTAGFWENRIRDQLALTLGVGALAASYYEGRSLQRAYDRGEDLTAPRCEESLLWAVSFFRIAALAFRGYRDGIPRSQGLADVSRVFGWLGR